MTKYYEDLDVDASWDFGEYTLTEDEIVSFAESYDPQYFHTDKERAQESMFEGLIASGLHVFCVTFRMIVDDVYSNVAVIGGRGMDSFRIHTPVRPGDTLSGTVRVHEKRPSEHHPERGYVNWEVTVSNHRDETVLEYIDLSMIQRHTSASD